MHVPIAFVQNVVSTVIFLKLRLGMGTFLVNYFCFQRLLSAFIKKLFTSKSFEGDFTLVSNMEGTGKKISMPDGMRLVVLKGLVYVIDSHERLNCCSYDFVKEN